jgi:hypothetical protein
MELLGLHTIGTHAAGISVGAAYRWAAPARRAVWWPGGTAPEAPAIRPWSLRAAPPGGLIRARTERRGRARGRSATPAPLLLPMVPMSGLRPRQGRAPPVSCARAALYAGVVPRKQWPGASAQPGPCPRAPLPDEAARGLLARAGGGTPARADGPRTRVRRGVAPAPPGPPPTSSWGGHARARRGAALARHRGEPRAGRPGPRPYSRRGRPGTGAAEPTGPASHWVRTRLAGAAAPKSARAPESAYAPWRRPQNRPGGGDYSCWAVRVSKP